MIIIKKEKKNIKNISMQNPKKYPYFKSQFNQHMKKSI